MPVPKDEITVVEEGQPIDNVACDEEGVVIASLSPTGAEILDPTPMEPPLGYIKQPSLAEQIRTMVRSEKLRMAAEEAGMETFEEADDFEVGDDFDPSSPYENEFDPDYSEIVKDVETLRSEKAKVKEKPASEEPVGAKPDETETPAG